MKKIFIVIICCIISIVSVKSYAQKDSCHVRISVITCAPGNELYSLFGHTALRIIDSSSNSDVVYNWGTFNFEEPNFYLKFIKGQLLYYAAADKLEDFLYEYQVTQRSVYEQELNITCTEKQKIIDAVAFNMLGNNKYYKYDFLFDNCTTRIRDIILNQLNQVSLKNNLVPSGTTFRNMLYGYLDRGGQPWSKLGIDILLGSEIDKPANLNQSMFLPEYLMKGLDSASAQSAPLVEHNKVILTATPSEENTGVYTPLAYFGIVCLILFWMGTLKNKTAIKITGFLDALLLYITGLMGILLLFMWFGTDHKACSYNYNLLWALPTNLIVAFFMGKRPAWLKKYFLIAAIITALLLIGWFWLPQEFNIALAPLVLLLLNRYIQLAK